MKRVEAKHALLSVLVLAAGVLGWQAYVVLFKVPMFLLPAPTAVAAQLALMAKDGSLAHHAGVTSLGIAAGFLLGSALGFACGYLMSKSRVVEDALMPYVMVVQATPKVSLIPLIVIWFGLGTGAKLLIIVLSAFFPVMLNTVVALRSTPADYHDLMRILNATRSQTLFRMKLPLAVPMIAAGLKVAMVQAVIGAIVAEWVSGKDGLGYLLVFGSTQFNSKLLIASILATTALGLCFYWAIDLIEARLLFWHESRTVFEENL